MTALPTELAILLVGVASRQAASPTGRLQARLAAATPQSDPLAPTSGAFSALVASALTQWKEG